MSNAILPLGGPSLRLLILSVSLCCARLYSALCVDKKRGHKTQFVRHVNFISSAHELTRLGFGFHAGIANERGFEGLLGETPQRAVGA